MATRIRAFDWSATPLGTIADWPQSLKTVVDLMLATPQPAIIGWGPDLVLLYNGDFASLLGIRHSSVLGLPCHSVWSGTWTEFQHEAAAVMAGRSLRLTFPPRSPERPVSETTWSSSWIPIRREDGSVGGFYGVVIETTSSAEERLLAASETARAQVTATLESIGDAFYAVDGGFRFTYVNAKAEAWWGRPRETLIGRNLWFEFPTAIGGEPHAQHLAAMRDRKPAQFEGFSPVLGRWMEASLYPDAVSGGLACYFRDVTERRAAEAALRESEERYRTLFESINEGFCIAERVPSARIDFRFLAVNPAFARQTGIADVVGRTMREMVPEIGEADLERYDRVANGGKSESVTAFVFDREYEIEASATGNAGQVALLFHDVTMAKQAERTLRESEERQTFLLTLSDALRAEPDADAIAYRALTMLSDNLRLDRCYITYYRPADDAADFPYQIGNDTVPPLPVTVRLSDFPDAYQQVLEKTYVINDDFERRGLSDAERANSTALGMRAMLASTVRRGEKNPLASMAAVSSRPRHWTPAEIALVEETAERTWAAIERARAEAALRRSEEKFRTLFESIDEAFLINEMIRDVSGRAIDLRMLEANPSYTRQTGLGLEMVGKLGSEILPNLEPFWLETYDRVARTGVPERVENYNQDTGRWYSVHISRVAGQDQQVAVVFDDITQRKRAEAALRESEARLAHDLEATQMLQNISNQLISKPGVNGHFDELCEAARALMRSDCASIQVYDHVTAKLELVGHMGFHPDSAAFWKWVDAGFGSACGRALSTGERVIVPDIDLFEADALDVEAFRRSSILSVQSTPLVARTGQVVGMMSTQWHRRDATAEASYRFFDILARLAADFIVRIRADAALRESEERQRLTVELVPALLWSASPDGQEVTLNEGWLAHTGPSEADGQNNGWLNAVHPDDLPATQAALEYAFVTGEPLERQQRIGKAGDGWRWHLVRQVPVRDEDGAITRWFGAAVDIHESKLAEQALRETELRLQSLVEGVPQHVWRAVDGGHWTWASPQWTEFTGQAEPDSHAWGWLDPVHPDDRAGVKEIWGGAIERGSFQADYRIFNMVEDRYRWFQTRATAVRDDSGAIIEWLGTSTDVDDLRGLQERQQVLVAELQHRTRNLMGVVRSTANRTGETSKDFADFKDRFRDRLEALARVQGLLSRLNETDRIAFDELIQTEIAAMHGSGERVSLDGPSGIRLRSSMVQTLAMALHELATNAVKYGALGQPDGHLAISWRMVEADRRGQPRLRIEWRESGVKMPAPNSLPQGGGQGRELIERALPYQLSAETSFELGPDGVHCTITIPVSATKISEDANG
ncbi:PAS domain-containing protein [Rhizobium wenxiniae]|uniref:Blue-light-activated histidine kinase n=1 Tax=Rhizobium wenxiniae TaxID=1737357 RepID=A0A7W9YCW5_9HYPH|nr:PAS domain-containing protein [Rhizobium wenxiniae]MBB6165563.1 PAS domain S-box-containing protein [Rhizobium wenxiniae]